MAHNLIYYDSVNSSIVQADDSVIDELSEYILEEMASGNYAGSVTTGIGSEIGTFVDTVRQGGVGSDDITVVSNTYTLRQIESVQSVSVNDPPMYFGLTVDSQNNQVILQENATSLDDLADEIIDRMVNSNGPNSYYLGTSAPSDGGTWVSLGSLKDTLENFTVTNTDYKLWHKISSPTYSGGLPEKRPMKLVNGSEIVEFSDSEMVDSLIRKVEQRILATGIGSYVLQSTAPSTGTWENAGTVVDVRRITEDVPYSVDVNYTQEYVRESTVYTANYQQEYILLPTYQADYTSDTGGVNVVNYVGSLDYFGDSTTVNFSVAYTTSYIRAAYIADEPYEATIYARAYTEEYFTVYIIDVPYTGDVSYFKEYITSETYTEDYEGIASAYVKTYDKAYVSDQTTYFKDYTGTVDYTGTIVASGTENVSSVTLWKRVA